MISAWYTTLTEAALMPHRTTTPSIAARPKPAAACISSKATGTPMVMALKNGKRKRGYSLEHNILPMMLATPNTERTKVTTSFSNPATCSKNGSM